MKTRSSKKWNKRTRRQRGGKRRELRPGKPYQDLEFLIKEFDVYIIIGHGSIDEYTLNPVPANTFIYNTARAGNKCGSVDEQLQLEMLADEDRTDEAADFFDKPNPDFPAIYEPEEYFPEHTYSFHNTWNPSMPNLIPLGVYQFPMNRYFTDTWDTLRKRIQPALSERNLGRQETMIKELIPEWDRTFLSLTGNLLTKHDISREYTLSDIMAWPEMAPKGKKGRIFVTWSCRSLIANTIPEATALRMERVRRLSAAPPRTPLNLAKARVNTLEADRLAYVAAARKLLLERNIPEGNAEEMAQGAYERKLTQLQLNVARLSGEGGAGAAPLPAAPAPAPSASVPLPSAPVPLPSAPRPAAPLPSAPAKKFVPTPEELAASRALYSRRNWKKSLADHAKTDPLFTRYKKELHSAYGFYPLTKKTKILRDFYTSVVGIPESHLNSPSANAAGGP